MLRLAPYRALVCRPRPPYCTMAGDESEADVTETTLHCSFCGKSQHDVRKLVAGPRVFICDECIDISYDIVHPQGALSPRETDN